MTDWLDNNSFNIHILLFQMDIMNRRAVIFEPIRFLFRCIYMYYTNSFLHRCCSVVSAQSVIHHQNANCIFIRISFSNVWNRCQVSHLVVRSYTNTRARAQNCIFRMLHRIPLMNDKPKFVDCQNKYLFHLYIIRMIIYFCIRK